MRKFLYGLFVGSLWMTVSLQGAPMSSLTSFYALNTTGASADSFMVFYGGVDPSNIAGTYTGSYTNATVTGVNGGTLISWTGGATPNGTQSQFGITFGQNIFPTTFTYSWGSRGSTIGAVAVATTQTWVTVNTVNGPLRPIDVITPANSTAPIPVQRRVVAGASSSIGFADLSRGGPLWNSAQLIDTSFVSIAPGQTLSYTFPTISPGSFALMMYDVQDPASGQTVMTFLNGVLVVGAAQPTVTVPTLSAWGLAALAILLIASVTLAIRRKAMRPTSHG
jgi:hypothetical protein